MTKLSPEEIADAQRFLDAVDETTQLEEAFDALLKLSRVDQLKLVSYLCMKVPDLTQTKFFVRWCENTGKDFHI